MLSKKFMTAILSVLLVFSLVLTACGKEKLGAEEVLQNVLDASMEMKSYSFDGNLKMSIEAPEQSLDSQSAMAFEFLKNIELNMSGIHHQEAMQTEVTLDLKLGDMSFSVPMVLTEQKMWIKVPNIPIPGFALPPDLIGKYIELDFEELSQMAGEDMPVSPNSVDVEKMKQLGLEVYAIFTKHYEEDDYFTVYDAKDTNVPESIKAEQVVEFKITNENLAPAVTIFMEKVMPEILDLLSDPEWAEALQLTTTDIEEAKQGLEDSKADFEAGLAEFKESVIINDFSITMAVDKKNYIPYQEVNVDLDITEEGQTGKVIGNLTMSLSDINENPEFIIGIPGEDESVKMDQLMQMFMGGF
jgi:hypothetical protein